jgi:glycosyltransferase involved in cell wall biosynthesis
VVQRLRVVVDGMGLVRDSAFRGIGTYCREIVRGLAELPDIDLAVLLCERADVPIGVSTRRVVRVAPGRWARGEHDILLPLDLARVRADVLFSPGLNPPRWSPLPVVQTLHDVIPFTDAHVDPSERRWAKRVAERWRRVDAVIAVSGHTAEEASRFLAVSPSRLHVVPHGVGEQFRPAESSAAHPYVLFVGEYDRRKRHGMAFEVISRIADAGLPHTLKVAGRVAPWYASSLQGEVQSARRPNRIEVLGFQEPDALVRLYQEADALIVTSSAEGFGFPAVEAMACGTPVIAFANSATREVVKDGGVLIEDGDVEAMARSVEAVVRDGRLRGHLRERALDRARYFTWRESARRHADILRDVARGDKGILDT